MMLRTSFLILLWTVPLCAFAASKIEVGTQIQVVDAQGNTEVREPVKPRKAPEEDLAIFSPPQICTKWISTDRLNEKPSITIPKEHPLSTRIESQRSSLNSLVQRLSVAPYLSSTEDASLRKSLLSDEILLATSSEIIDCLSALEASVRSNLSKDQRELTTRISTTLLGLRYGIQNVFSKSNILPLTKDEALYAGDILQRAHPHITSLSITDTRVDGMFILPVSLFGRWSVDATVSFSLGEEDVMDAPWWISLGNHRLSSMRDQIHALTPKEKGVAGMFLYAEQVANIISS